MIALGSDHGGLALKRHVMDYLDQHQLAYKDYGCYTSDSPPANVTGASSSAPPVSASPSPPTR